MYKCPIYLPNIQSWAKIGVEIYKYQKYVVLALNLVKIWEFSRHTFDIYLFTSVIYGVGIFCLGSVYNASGLKKYLHLCPNYVGG